MAKSSGQRLQDSDEGVPVAKLIYSAITSLDEYVADESGRFDWAAPSEEVHAFVNDLERRIGTYLYGRRMYEVMKYWETAPTTGSGTREMLDYANIWKAAEKVVYSKSLESVTTAMTRVERQFDPEAVRRMKAKASRTSAWVVPISRPRRSTLAWWTRSICS